MEEMWTDYEKGAVLCHVARIPDSLARGAWTGYVLQKGNAASPTQSTFSLDSVPFLPAFDTNVDPVDAARAPSDAVRQASERGKLPLIPFVALRRKAILNAESAFRQSAKKVLGRKITDLEVEQLLADEAARANAEVEARKARQLGVQSLSHVNRTRAVESGQRSVEAYKDRQSSRKDGLGLDYESQARLNAQRQQEERDQRQMAETIRKVEATSRNR